MFWRIYRTRLKCLCRNYDTLFWSFGFPIILSIFFYMAFMNINTTENLNTISIAYVNEENDNNDFLSILKSVELSDDKKMFDVTLSNLSEAKVLLNEDKIVGYIVYKEEPSLFIKKNGIEQTIIKSFLDSFMRMNHTTMNVHKMNPDINYNILMEELITNENYIVDGGKESKNPNPVIIYFYTLIALACLFGTNWGFKEMMDLQADQSAIGARLNVAPTHKLKLMLYNLSAAFTLHFLSILLLLAFLYYVLRIDLGEHLSIILLICFIGSLCGIFLGAFVGVQVKANTKVRGAILNVIVLGGGFLSGMMIMNIKHMIAKHAPLLGYINPSNLITDAFYSLYYYESYERLTLNLLALSAITVALGVLTYFGVRRRDYASI